MPAHEEENSSIAYYRQAALDGSRPGQYYINTSHPETRPRYESRCLAYHESVPGHHLQIAIGQELTALPDFRRHLGPTAFFEGWGLYTERLADQMGLYDTDVDRFGMLSMTPGGPAASSSTRGCTRFGWTRRQAIDYMTANTALAENNIANEVDRYIVWPGQALAYKVGQLEILALRVEAERRLGGRVRHPGLPRRGPRQRSDPAAHPAGGGRGRYGRSAVAQLHWPPDHAEHGPTPRTPAMPDGHHPYDRPTDPAKRHSARLTDGPDRAAARAMLKAIGFTDDDLAKPLVGVQRAVEVDLGLLPSD